MTNPHPPKPRSKRIYVYWTAALLLLLALGTFCWKVAVPVLTMRNITRRIQAGTLEPAAAVSGLGGPAAAARKASLYLRLPESLAPRGYAAVRLLNHCGDAAVDGLAAALGRPEARARWHAALGLGDRPTAAGGAAAALEGALGDRDRRVREAARWALEKIRGQQPPTPRAGQVAEAVLNACYEPHVFRFGEVVRDRVAFRTKDPRRIKRLLDSLGLEAARPDDSKMPALSGSHVLTFVLRDGKRLHVSLNLPYRHVDWVTWKGRRFVVRGELLALFEKEFADEAIRCLGAHAGMLRRTGDRRCVREALKIEKRIGKLKELKARMGPEPKG